MRILAILGSLREGSYNAAVLNALPRWLPEGAELVKAPSLGELPFLNEDLRTQDTLPSSVRDFLSEVEQADALVWVTPEYNHSIPGVVKNAIDWLPHPLAKASAVIVTTPGRGGLRCMTEMTRILREMGGVIAPGYPEPCIQYAADQLQIDPQGRIEFLNPGVEKMLESTLSSLVEIAETGVAETCGRLFRNAQAEWHGAQLPPIWVRAEGVEED